MSYLSFINDEHFLNCIQEVLDTYIRCKSEALKKFNKNKVDVIKFCFDMNVYNNDFYTCSKLEILRQSDKTISNAIGYFHQHMLGGIDGFQDMGVGGGCDIRNLDNTIFAEVKNKHNTMNSSSGEATYQKLQTYAENYPNSTCYLVEIIAKESQDIQWNGSLNGEYYNHPRVRKISADKFYELATGNKNAFKEICYVLPVAITYLLNKNGQDYSNAERTFKELKDLMNITFNGYNGF